MKTPSIVTPSEWEAARQQLLVKEKALTHARDALAAERRRMPWLAVEKEYVFDGPAGTASLLKITGGVVAGIDIGSNLSNRAGAVLRRSNALATASFLAGGLL